jgi:hypothetical protein
MLIIGVYSDESPRLCTDVPLAVLHQSQSAAAAWPLLDANLSLPTLQSLLHRYIAFIS